MLTLRVSSCPGDFRGRSPGVLAKQSPIRVQPPAVGAGAMPGVAPAPGHDPRGHWPSRQQQCRPLPALRRHAHAAAFHDHGGRGDSRPASDACVRNYPRPCDCPLLASHAIQSPPSVLFLRQVCAFHFQSNSIRPLLQFCGRSFVVFEKTDPQRNHAALLHDFRACSSFPGMQSPSCSVPGGKSVIPS